MRAIELAFFSALERAEKEGFEMSSIVRMIRSFINSNSFSFDQHDRNYYYFSIRNNNESHADSISEKINEVLTKKIRHSACFAGNEWDGFTNLSISEKTSRMVFSNNTLNIYCVDCITIGAFYMFDKKEYALDWATHSIDYKEARKRAIYWTTHKGEWNYRVEQVLARYY